MQKNASNLPAIRQNQSQSKTKGFPVQRGVLWVGWAGRTEKQRTFPGGAGGVDGLAVLCPEPNHRTSTGSCRMDGRSGRCHGSFQPAPECTSPSSSQLEPGGQCGSYGHTSFAYGLSRHSRAFRFGERDTLWKCWGWCPGWTKSLGAFRVSGSSATLG